jgi:16S rRNA (guanine527-N7)-methyltransferase
MKSSSTTIVVYNGNDVSVPSSAAVTGAMNRFGVALDEHQVSQVQRYIAFLVFWNQRVSLTSVTDPIEILERHFAESMLAGPLIERSNGRLADVGTGAGFPGLALKILLPELQVILIERDTKKSVFLNEVVRLLNLDQVTVIRSDYALMPPSALNFDCITFRAVGGHKSLIKWCSESIALGGQVILWLGEQDSIKISQSEAWHWEPPLPIPHSQRRVILVGHRIP